MLLDVASLRECFEVEVGDLVMVGPDHAEVFAVLDGDSLLVVSGRTAGAYIATMAEAALTHKRLSFETFDEAVLRMLDEQATPMPLVRWESAPIYTGDLLETQISGQTRSERAA